MQTSTIISCVALLLTAVAADSCIQYVVQPGDYSYKIVNDICKTTPGCSQDAKNVFPTAFNAAGRWCPDDVFVGEKIQVCCTGKPVGTATVAPPAGSPSSCKTHTVVAGDYSYKLVNDICGVTTGCAQDAKDVFPTVFNAAGRWCPNEILNGEKIEICCTGKTTNAPSKAGPPSDEPTCVKHILKSGEYAYKLVNDICGVTTGCAQDAKDVFPTVFNAAGRWCPDEILNGEQLDICCTGKPISTPTTAPPAGRCPNVRQVKQTDVVYFTIDDGPSFGSRNHILDALATADVKVSFFDSGYNVCNDSDKDICKKFSYAHNVQSLVRTVKEGHHLASHSDNHYYDAALGKCSYLTVAPDVRPAARAETCGNAPVQNMVQGAVQLHNALQEATWTTVAERKLRDKAINDIWTYARLPCSDIWRTRGGINEDFVPGVSPEEKALRASIADEMISGDVACRPSRFNGVPWEVYGFNSNVEWFGDTILNAGEKCRMVKLIEEAMDLPVSNPAKTGKVTLLTHDYHFNSAEKSGVMREVISELRRKGYKFDTMDKYH